MITKNWKNWYQKSYILYLEDLANIDNINFNNTLSNKKSYKNIFIQHLPYKIPYSVNPLHIIFHEIDLLKTFDGKYLTITHVVGKIKMC